MHSTKHDKEENASIAESMRLCNYYYTHCLGPPTYMYVHSRAIQLNSSNLCIILSFQTGTTPDLN